MSNFYAALEVGTTRTVLATAEARPGWAFVGWRQSDQDGDILSTKAKWQIVVTNDAEYVAVFKKIPYLLGLADPADGGKVTGSGVYAVGKKANLSATAAKGYVFAGWYTDPEFEDIVCDAVRGSDALREVCSCRRRRRERGCDHRGRVRDREGDRTHCVCD